MVEATGAVGEAGALKFAKQQGFDPRHSPSLPDDVRARATYGPGTNIPKAASEILRLINDRQASAAA